MGAGDIFHATEGRFIIAIFMHVVWERLALVFIIFGPPTVLLLFIGLMAFEGLIPRDLL